MASIDKRPDGRYRLRWREYPGGPQKSRHFPRKRDAENHRTQIEHQLLSGAYTSPSAGQITLDDYAQEWMSRRHWRPATRDRVERELRLYIAPGLGQRPLASIRRSHVEEWAADLSLAPSSVDKVTATLRALLAAAVEDERIARNPATGASLPQVERPPFIPMTPDEVRNLAHAMADPLRAAVVVAAGTGVRQGELFGLTEDRLDLMRRQLRIDRQLWTPPRGQAVLAPPKAKRSYRTIALSDLVVDALVAHLRVVGTGAQGLVFHTGGAPVGRARASVLFRRAATQAALDGRTWHDLRHHHASVLLSEGVSPALVAERLGHDVATLMRTYAHVIRSDDDRVRAIVDNAMAGSVEDWLRTKAS